MRRDNKGMALRLWSFPTSKTNLLYMTKKKLKTEIIKLLKHCWWLPQAKFYSMEHPIPPTEKRDLSEEVLKKIDNILNAKRT